MKDAMHKLTVMKQRALSDQISVTVTIRVGHQGPSVEWDAPSSRSPVTVGTSVLTDAEAYQYGLVLGEAYQEFVRITHTTLIHTTEARCGAGMLESGATEVQYAGGAAIAVFVGKGEEQI